MSLFTKLFKKKTPKPQHTAISQTPLRQRGKPAAPTQKGSGLPDNYLNKSVF